MRIKPIYSPIIIGSTVYFGIEKSLEINDIDDETKKILKKLDKGISEKELYSYLKDITKKWLKENDIYYDEIFFEKDKKKIINENNIDLMIEDYEKNIKKIED